MAEVTSFSIIQSADLTSFTVEDTTGAYSSTNTDGYGAPNIATTDVTTANILVTKFNSATTYTINAIATLPNTSGALFTVASTDLGYSNTTDKIADGIYLIVYKLISTFTITAASSVTDKFTISGDRTGSFTAGRTFTVTGSSGAGNNITYTVISSTYTGSNTEITVAAIPTTSATGSILLETLSSKYEMFFGNVQRCLEAKLADVNISDCECLDEKLAAITKISSLIQATKYMALCGKANKATEALDYLTTLCNITPCTTCN